MFGKSKKKPRKGQFAGSQLSGQQAGVLSGLSDEQLRGIGKVMALQALAGVEAEPEAPKARKDVPPGSYLGQSVGVSLFLVLAAGGAAFAALPEIAADLDVWLAMMLTGLPMAPLGPVAVSLWNRDHYTLLGLVIITPALHGYAMHQFIGWGIAAAGGQS